MEYYTNTGYLPRLLGAAVAQQSALQVIVHGLIASHHYCVGSKPALATLQHVRKFDSYLPMVGDFLRALRFPPPIKLSM